LQYLLTKLYYFFMSKSKTTEETRLFKLIRLEGAKHGLNITDCANEVGAHRMTFEHWKEAEPRSIQIIFDLVKFFLEKGSTAEDIVGHLG
jgi:hypothetical protein